MIPKSGYRFFRKRSCSNKKLEPSSDSTKNDRALDRHPYRRPQSTQWAIGERNLAAVRARNIARNGKTEPRVSLVLIARVVEPHERPEYFFAHFHWNARSVIVDIHRQPAMVAMAGDGSLFRKA